MASRLLQSLRFSSCPPSLPHPPYLTIPSLTHLQTHPKDSWDPSHPRILSLPWPLTAYWETAWGTMASGKTRGLESHIPEFSCSSDPVWPTWTSHLTHPSLSTRIRETGKKEQVLRFLLARVKKVCSGKPVTTKVTCQCHDQFTGLPLLTSSANKSPEDSSSLQPKAGNLWFKFIQQVWIVYLLCTCTW